MWNRLKKLMGIGGQVEYFDEILCSLHREVLNRNFYFHLFIIFYELIMIISISLRPGGPFVKPRRVAYFLMYLILILATVCTMAAEAWVDKKQKDSCRLYFRIEHIYMAFFGFWGIAVTLTDQLGGNGLTVYTYAILILGMFSLMKPWKTSLLIVVYFMVLNALLPYFPDPAGLDNTYNNFMNSLFLSLASIAIATSLYNSKINAKKSGIIISKQCQLIAEKNKLLREEAHIDVLTGLRNRNRFKQAMQEFDETDFASFACIYADVNGLHEINNHMGHQAGDLMLKTVAGILLNHFSPEESFRIGGDEFVMLCPDLTYEVIARRLELMCRQIEASGYSVSIGLEWRNSELDVKGIVQAAEAAMRKNKKEYYSSQGGERQKRMLNQKLEQIISEKKDAERFLSVLAPVFKGVYCVDLVADTSRQLFAPSYFKEILDENDNVFSKAIMMYADRLIEPEYFHLFERFCDYGHLVTVLEEDEIPGFVYQKRNGERMRLRVLKFNHAGGNDRETLWIFSEVEGE